MFNYLQISTDLQKDINMQQKLKSKNVTNTDKAIFSEYIFGKL